MSTTGLEDGSTTQDPSIMTQRGLLNLKKFESSFKESLDKAMANFSADMLLRVYCADLPYYFFTKIRSIEDERWRVFFTEHVLVFHNHISMKGKKNMSLDSISADEVFQKSYFDWIPVVARSQPKKIIV
jgi:hypothetical protein